MRPTPGSTTARCGSSRCTYRPGGSPPASGPTTQIASASSCCTAGQIDELLGKTQQQSLTIIPVKLYFKDGKAKVEIALAKGRRLYDKRNLIMARDAEREAARATKEINRGGWA